MIGIVPPADPDTQAWYPVVQIVTPVSDRPFIEDKDERLTSIVFFVMVPWLTNCRSLHSFLS